MAANGSGEYVVDGGEDEVMIISSTPSPDTPPSVVAPPQAEEVVAVIAQQQQQQQQQTTTTTTSTRKSSRREREIHRATQHSSKEASSSVSSVSSVEVEAAPSQQKRTTSSTSISSTENSGAITRRKTVPLMTSTPIVEMTALSQTEVAQVRSSKVTSVTKRSPKTRVVEDGDFEDLHLPSCWKETIKRLLRFILLTLESVTILNTHTLLIIILSMFTVFSVFHDFIPQFIPVTYFSRGNVINDYFVKLSWGWTGGLLTLFISLTSYVLGNERVSYVGLNLIRPVVGTVVWYFWTTVFMFYQDWTRGCSNPDFDTELICAANDETWFQGVDISGHAFLLLFCILMINEEVKLMCFWDGIPSCTLFNANSLIHIRSEKRSNLLHYHSTLSTPVKFLFSLLAMLQLIWYFMFLMTGLYFHDLITKLTGVLLAVVCWWVMYRCPCTFVVPPGQLSGGLAWISTKPRL